jgi:mRNA interferase HigB
MGWLMRIIALKTIREFWENPRNSESERALRHWYQIATSADWSSPQAVKFQYGNASVVGNNRVVFNIAGNKYRLVVKFNYARQIGYIRFIGTHAQYNVIKAETV